MENYRVFGLRLDTGDGKSFGGGGDGNGGNGGDGGDGVECGWKHRRCGMCECFDAVNRAKCGDLPYIWRGNAEIYRVI